MVAVQARGSNSNSNSSDSNISGNVDSNSSAGGRCVAVTVKVTAATAVTGGADNLRKLSVWEELAPPS